LAEISVYFIFYLHKMHHTSYFFSQENGTIIATSSLITLR